MRRGAAVLILAAVLSAVLPGCAAINKTDDSPELSSSAQGSTGWSEEGQTPVTPPSDPPQVPETEAADGDTEPEASINPPAESAPSGLGALSVRGTALVDENGDPVRLRGVSTHGLSWFPQYVNEALFAEMADDWGINVIRLALYTAESGGWCTNGDRDTLKKLVLDGVEYAEKAGLYVIVDWHILSDGDPNTHKADAKAFFTDISAELKDKNNVLYEICNEPNGGTSWQEIAAYAREVIPVIRENVPNAVILVGTPNWSQRVDEAVKAPLSEFDNVMYTLHFYAGTHRSDLRNTMVAAIEAGLPVFVSEFGITDASGSGGIDEAEADRWMETMDEYGVSCVMWNLSNKAEDSSVIKSSCDKTGGFDKNDLTTAGKWLLRTLSGTSSPEITDPGSAPVPEREPSRDPEIQPGAEGPSVEEPLSFTIELSNSWKSGEDEFRQYAITVTNTTAGTVRGWRVEIPMEAAFELQSFWNGIFTVNGAILTVTNADYNGTLAPGESAADVGVIVKMTS